MNISDKARGHGNVHAVALCLATAILVTSCSAPDSTSSAPIAGATSESAPPPATATASTPEPKDAHGPVFASCTRNGLVVFVLDVQTGRTTDIANYSADWRGTDGDCLGFGNASGGQGMRPNFNSDFTKVAASFDGGGLGYWDATTGEQVNVSDMAASTSPFKSKPDYRDIAFDLNDDLVALKIDPGRNTTFDFYDTATGAIVTQVPTGEFDNHPAEVPLPWASLPCDIDWRVGKTNLYIRTGQTKTGSYRLWNWEAPYEIAANENIDPIEACTPETSKIASPESDPSFNYVAADPMGDGVYFALSNGGRQFYADADDPENPREITQEAESREPQGVLLDWI